MCTFKTTTDLDSQTYKDSLGIRMKVFLGEQNVPIEVEIADEEICLHVVLYMKQDNSDTDIPMATARLYPYDEETLKVQRVAVIEEGRGKGLGDKMMRYLEDYAKEEGAAKLILGAQTHALAFYQKLGYESYDERYLEAGIEHQNMQKILK